MTGLACRFASARKGLLSVHSGSLRKNPVCPSWIDSGPPLKANIRISCMSAFGGTLYVHTHLVFVAVHASGVTFGDSGHFDCVSGKMKNTGRFSVRHSGRTAWKLGIITQKVSSSCEIILKLKPKCRYCRRVRGGTCTEGRRKPESETSGSGSLCAAGQHPNHCHRGRAEGVSGAPRRCRFSSRPSGPEN